MKSITFYHQTNGEKLDKYYKKKYYRDGLFTIHVVMLKLIKRTSITWIITFLNKTMNKTVDCVSGNCIVKLQKSDMVYY